MDQTINIGLGTLLKRVGLVFFGVAAFLWFFAQNLIVKLVGLDRNVVWFWVPLAAGAAVLIGVLAYCLGEYTFAD